MTKKKIIFLKIYIKLVTDISIRKEEKKRSQNNQSIQSHYLPEKVSGKIDQKTLGISHFLANLR